MKTLGHGSIKAAWKTVRRNRVRSFLTMLGVIIGVASVISVAAIGEGVKQQVAKQISHVGNDVLVVRAGQVSTQANRTLSLFTGLRVGGSLGGHDSESVSKALPNATVVPLSLVDGAVGYNHAVATNMPVIATTAELPSLLNQGLAYGSFFTHGDNTEPVAVLGQVAALDLFKTVVPLGESFNFRGQTFTVQGVFNDFGSMPLANDVDFNNAIFIPSGTAQRLTNSGALPYELLVKPARDTTARQAVAAATAALLKNHGATQDFAVLTSADQLAQASSTVNLLTEMIVGVAAIALLVGGIGIMNVTFVSVSERMHEVGIRKAVGATNRQILSEFMSEAIVLSVTGCILGIIAAGVVEVVLRLLTSLQPVIKWQVVLLAAGVSIAIGILFGSAPALKAARKDPISALRSE